MSTQPYFGLSHTKAWGDVGDSYSSLAQSELEEARRASHSKKLEPLASTAPAGVLSSAKSKGAGSFQLQVD